MAFSSDTRLDPIGLKLMLEETAKVSHKIRAVLFSTPRHTKLLGLVHATVFVAVRQGMKLDELLEHIAGAYALVTKNKQETTQ